MRSILAILAWAVVITVLVVGGSQLASAGSPEAPEITDPAGDCAVPYGNLYLDITSAWIDNEDADSFDVHLALAGWEDEVAEGAGYAVQFVHQQLQWGVIAFYSPAVEGGWVFWTGQATLADVSDTVDAVGSFDVGASTIHVTFPKDLFPHVDATDTTLREIMAMSVDVRPAYPFIVGGDTPASTDPDGKWVACDEAVSSATFQFTQGGHSVAHAPSDTAPSPSAGASGDVEGAAVEAAPTAATPAQTASKDTSLPALVAIGALLYAAMRRRA